MSFIPSFIPSLCPCHSFLHSFLLSINVILSFIPSLYQCHSFLDSFSLLPCHSFLLSINVISSFIPSLYRCHSFLHSFPRSVYPCRMYNTTRCGIWRESVTTEVEWRTIRTVAPCWRSSTITTVRRSSRTRSTASTTAEFTTHRPTERSVSALN